jgi:hypothetical protein
LQITKTSPLTGKQNTMDLPITEEQLGRWQRREGLIQNIMPELSAGQREFLMSGYTEEDWATLFPPEDE